MALLSAVNVRLPYLSNGPEWTYTFDSVGAGANSGRIIVPTNITNGEIDKLQYFYSGVTETTLDVFTEQNAALGSHQHIVRIEEVVECGNWFKFWGSVVFRNEDPAINNCLNDQLTVLFTNVGGVATGVISLRFYLIAGVSI